MILQPQRNACLLLLTVFFTVNTTSAQNTTIPVETQHNTLGLKVDDHQDLGIYYQQDVPEQRSVIRNSEDSDVVSHKVASANLYLKADPYWLPPNTLPAQEIIDLYPSAIPNAIETNQPEGKIDPATGLFRRVIRPTLEVYLPEKDQATGAAVVICPGGGYAVVVYEAEGVRTAQELAKNGVAAFVLKYRLPNDSTMREKQYGPLQDAQQAIKLVRARADQWGVDSSRVGIMGFSAGGHLAATAATHYEPSRVENTNHTSLRPDFQILVYPVISMQDSLTHPDSRTRLLGPRPTPENIEAFSNEQQVNQDTPPAFLIHAGDDPLVSVENSIAYYEALRHHNVAAELHLYPEGGHGFVLRQPTEEWMHPLFRWMRNSGWLNK